MTFHIETAAEFIELVTDENLAREFRTRSFNRFVVAETVKVVLDRKGEDGQMAYDFIIARIEMHNELKAA